MDNGPLQFCGFCLWNKRRNWYLQLTRSLSDVRTLILFRCKMIERLHNIEQARNMMISDVKKTRGLFAATLVLYRCVLLIAIVQARNDKLTSGVRRMSNDKKRARERERENVCVRMYVCMNTTPWCILETKNEEKNKKIKWKIKSTSEKNIAVVCCIYSMQF